ncbi:hypothetical protein WN55_09289 [Dufourea novaeangliae]|uniref:Uncharacterized protein n=1 Tax=Dufourea novaeangliae TaxID=178035 RepID=A0A154P8Z1_DUFNO|nr:hypothetical protein WN55_09289 [Dufourea novaeangliae]
MIYYPNCVPYSSPNETQVKKNTSIDSSSLQVTPPRIPETTITHPALQSALTH